MKPQVLKGAKHNRASRIWARDPDDWYVEESWQSARLFEVLREQKRPVRGPLLDPACGFGRVVLSARSAGIDAYGSDIRARWQNWPSVFRVENFLKPKPIHSAQWPAPQTIVSNPPFRQVRAFYDRVMQIAPRVIFLLPCTWMCGADISEWLETTPLVCIYPLGPRASMPPGQYILDGGKPKNGRVDHCWYEWGRGMRPRIHGGRPEVLAIRRNRGGA